MQSVLSLLVECPKGTISCYIVLANQKRRYMTSLTLIVERVGAQ